MKKLNSLRRIDACDVGTNVRVDRSARVNVEPIVFKDGFYDYVMMRGDHYTEIATRLTRAEEAAAAAKTFSIPIAKTPNGGPLTFCSASDGGVDDIEVYDLDTGEIAKGASGQRLAFIWIDTIKGVGEAYDYSEDHLAARKVYGHFVLVRRS